MKTYREIKNMLDTFDEKQLDQVAEVWSTPDDGIKGGHLEFSIFDEDQYYSEDGCFPKSSISEEEFAEYLIFMGDDARIAIPYGTVMAYLEPIAKPRNSTKPHEPNIF